MKTHLFISILLFGIFFQNCEKTFRKENQVDWIAEEPINTNINSLISDDSKTERKEGFYNEFQKIEEKTKKEYETMVEQIIKDSKLINQDLTIHNSEKLKIELKHTIKRDKRNFWKVFLTGITLQLYPFKVTEHHSIEITISKDKEVIFKKESIETVHTFQSYWFFFLLNFYSNATAQNRIFYEHSSILIKEFFDPKK